MQLMTNNNKTMSSREIAELTGKQHSKVIIVIADLMDRGIAKSATPSMEVNPQNGQLYKKYNLDKRDSLVLVARLSPEFTANVIDRWQELEQKVIETPEQLLARAVISAQTVIDEKNQLLEQAKPAIELHESIVNDEGTLSMRDAGKQLQVKPNKFIEWLAEVKYIQASRLAYQSKIDAGYMRLSTTEHNGKPRTNTRVTGKGFAHLGKKIAEVRFANPSHNMFYKS